MIVHSNGNHGDFTSSEGVINGVMPAFPTGVEPAVTCFIGERPEFIDHPRTRG
jgi:hypothetical protein